MNGSNGPQHIRHDKEPHVAAADIDLFEMADTPVARGDRDVFELYVHVVFGCNVSPSVRQFGFLIILHRGRGGSAPSISLPRYVWPEVISRVTMWPCVGLSVG